MLKSFRQTLLFIWIVSLLGLAIWLFRNPEFLDPQKLLAFFQSFGSIALFVYIIISFIRGIFLLPSLPLVFVGILFFPDNPHLVFFISMLGIIFSSILVYGFSELMGFDKIFLKHASNKKIKDAIGNYGFYAVMIWSFVPVVPTDLICYVAGIVRMNFWKFILAISLGEGLIVGLIVYAGSRVVDWMTL